MSMNIILAPFYARLTLGTVSTIHSLFEHESKLPKHLNTNITIEKIKHDRERTRVQLFKYMIQQLKGSKSHSS